MLVVDASCLFEVVADTPRSGEIAAHLAAEVEQAAPHVIDVEVMGVIRAQHLRGQLDGTTTGFGTGMGCVLRGAGGGVRCDATDARRAACPRSWANLPDRGPRCAGLNVTRTRSGPTLGPAAGDPQRRRKPLGHSAVADVLPRLAEQ